eukprot:TRINITY_DN13582_c0_g1_i1.p1 TRINITY_DN13582_c0_g1~~TRINITY_DN13582_c0_g1_i1.p1  ORF type:complete len:3471 (+),score=1007.92 TRINITY_DN13582_c0_g1_i1:1254-10415(+)
MAGEQGADETTARFIAERLNEVLRGLQGNCSNAELANVVTSAITHATEIACMPTPEEATAMALKERLEHALGSPEHAASVEELVATAKHLSEVQGGVVGSSMRRIVAELMTGEPTGRALEMCSSALAANMTLKQAANMLQQQLDSGELNVNELIVCSGELALAAATLEGEAKEQFYALSERLTQASRMSDTSMLGSVIADISTAMNGPEPEEAPGVTDVSATLQSLLECIASEGVHGEGAQARLQELDHLRDLCPGADLLFAAIDAYIAHETKEHTEGSAAEEREEEEVLGQDEPLLSTHIESLQQLLASGASVDDVSAKAAVLLPVGSIIANALANAPRDLEGFTNALQVGAAAHAGVAEVLQALERLEDDALLQPIEGSVLQTLASDLASGATDSRPEDQVAAVTELLAKAAENREYTATSLAQLRDEIAQVAGLTASDSTERLSNVLKNLATSKQGSLDANELKKAALLARVAAAKNVKAKIIADKLDACAERVENGGVVHPEELVALVSELEHAEYEGGEGDLERLSDLLHDKAGNKDAILELLQDLSHRTELQGLLGAINKFVTQSAQPSEPGHALTEAGSNSTHSQGPGTLSPMVLDLSNPEAVAMFVDRLRSGEDLTEEAKKIVGRLRASSTKMVGLADEAERCLMQGNLHELADVLGRAMVVETFSPEDLAVPQVAPKYTSLHAALKELRNKYARGIPVPGTYVEDIKEKAGIIGCIGRGCVESVCAAIAEVPLNAGGYFALKAASKRHVTEQFMTAAGLLKAGSVAEAVQSCEVLAEGLALGRRALASAMDAEWGTTCEGVEQAIQAVDLAASRLSVCEVDTSGLAEAKEHLVRAAASAASNTSDEAAQSVKSAVNLIKAAVHCGTSHKQQVSIGVGKALTELSKAMTSDFADKVVIGEQLAFLRREVQNTVESTPSASVLHKSLARVATELAQLNITSASAASECQKIASRLRNSVDAQNSVSKAAEMLQGTVKVFLSGRTEEGLRGVGQAAMMCDCLKTYSPNVHEDLQEVASASPDTPSMILAATADHIARQLSYLGGASNNEGRASCIAVSRLAEIEQAPAGEKVPLLDKLLADMLLISGMAASAGELGAAALGEKLYLLEQGTDPLVQAALRSESKEAAQNLASCSGVVGDAMQEVLALIDASDPDAQMVVDGVADCVGRLRDVANRLWRAEARDSITADELSLLGGCALSAVGYAPGSSGRCGVELAERLGEAASRKGRGLGVNIESLRVAAAEAAGLGGARPNEVHEMKAAELQALTAQARKLMADGCSIDLTEAASVLEEAATSGDISGKTLAAVAKVASLGSHLMLESLSAKIDGATRPFNLLLVATLLDDVAAHMSENPKLRGLLSTCEAHLKTLLAPRPILAETIANVTDHPQLGAELRAELLSGTEEISGCVTKLSDACAAALHSNCSEKAKAALRLVLSTVDSQGCTEAVILAAEEALKEGCAAPLVSATLQDVRQAHVNLARVASKGAKDATNPPEARYAMYNAAVAALVNQNRGTLDRDLLQLNGAEMCCVLKTKMGSGEIDNADLLELLDQCEVSDLPALQEAHAHTSRLEELIASLRSELEHGASLRENAEHETQQMQAQLAITQSQLSVIEEQLQKAEQFSDEREGRIVSLEDACSLLEGQLQKMETDGKGCNEQLTKIEEELRLSQSKVVQKEGELQQLQGNIETMRQDFETTLAKDRAAMQKAIEDAATAANVRQVLQGAVDESVSDVARRTLREIQETNLLPAHLRETVQQLIDHGGDLSAQCEALTAVQASGVDLPKAVVTMIDAAQGTEIHSGGLGVVSSSMEALADRIRRGSAVKVDSVREVSRQLRADGATAAAALVDEATRRLQAGDAVGASLILQSAAESAATTAAHGVPIHPRLAGLLADLEELHHRLSSGQRVTKIEISKLRDRALEAAALGCSATEACMRHLAKKASTAPKASLAHIADVAQASIQRHPEITELLNEFSQSVIASPLVAGALLAEAADVYEETRLVTVQAGELARRLQLGEIGSGIQAAAAHTAGVVNGIIEGTRHPSDALQNASACIRRAVDKLSGGAPTSPTAAVEMQEATQQAEIATGCGLQCAVGAGRRAASFCKDLLGKISTNSITGPCLELTVEQLVAELSSASLAAPSRSLIAVAIGDAAAVLGESSSAEYAKALQKSTNLLNDAADAQETIGRCLGKVQAAKELLEVCGGVAGGANQQQLKKATEALRLAGDAAGAASAACNAFPFVGFSGTLTRAAEDLREISTRCSACEIDSSLPAPSPTDVLAVASHLSKLGGRMGGDEAAARLIVERLRSMLESQQKKGELPVQVAESLHAFPAPVQVAAAEKETADVGPSAGEAAATALSVQLRKIEESLATGMTLQDSVEEVRCAARDALKAQTGESIVAKAMQAVEAHIHEAIEKQVPDAVIASIQRARELCDGAADASKSARLVARSLWGLESCAAYGLPPSRKDLLSLSEEALRGADRLDHDAATDLREINESLQQLADSLDVDISVLGKLRDSAATAAGLPVRNAGGIIADLASRTLALSARAAAGGMIDPTELTRLADEAKAAAARHPEAGPNLVQLSEELRDAATKSHDRESDLALGASYDRAKRLEESFSGPKKVDVSVQWPDAEGFLSDEESVQKMRATLGKQMQEEMTKLNAKWKKKLSESETVREELAAELAALAEQLAEAEVEMEALMQRNEELDREVATMQRDAMEGVEEIIADKNESLRLHAEALDSAARLKLEDHETIERLELEVATESHMARLVALMNERSVENWIVTAEAYADGSDNWAKDEARLIRQLQEASNACSSLEGAVTRIEQDKERLAYEMSEVEQAIQGERRRHEAEVQNLQQRIEQQNNEICELENALAENDTAEAMKAGMESGLRGEIEKYKELCSELNMRIAEYETKVDSLEEEARKARHEAKGGAVKVETLSVEIEKLERKTSAMDKLQYELEESRQTIAALRSEVEAAALLSSSEDIAALKKELAKMSAEREKAQQDHSRLENEAAEALEIAENERMRLEQELKESQQMVADLSEALEDLEA